MTQFTQKSFSVAEDSRSPVPEEERRRRWDETFGCFCEECSRRGWVQTPADQVKCQHCGHKFCKEHLASHVERGCAESDMKPREPGCQCHLEEGDSPCKVHGDESK